MSANCDPCRSESDKCVLLRQIIAAMLQQDMRTKIVVVPDAESRIDITVMPSGAIEVKVI